MYLTRLMPFPSRRRLCLSVSRPGVFWCLWDCEIHFLHRIALRTFGNLDSCDLCFQFHSHFHNLAGVDAYRSAPRRPLRNNFSRAPGTSWAAAAAMTTARARRIKRSCRWENSPAPRTAATTTEPSGARPPRPERVVNTIQFWSGLIF